MKIKELSNMPSIQSLTRSGYSEDEAYAYQLVFVEGALADGTCPPLYIGVNSKAYILLDVADVEDECHDRTFLRSFKAKCERLFTEALEANALECTFSGFKADLEFPALIGSVKHVLPLSAQQIAYLHSGCALYEVADIYPVEDLLGLPDGAICPGSCFCDEPSLSLVRG